MFAKSVQGESILDVQILVVSYTPKSNYASPYKHAAIYEI